MRPSVSSWFSRVLRLVAAWQITRPWSPILLGVALSVFGGVLASHLELRTRFDQLLPEHQASVVELRRLLERTGGQSNVFVVVEGSDTTVLRTFGDELVPKLRSLGPPWVTSADDGVQSSRAFLEPRSGLFAPLADLQTLQGDVEARWQWEVGEATSSNLDDTVPPPITAASIRKRFGAAHLAEANRFPDGYYQSKDGHALVVVARSSVVSGDLDKARETLARVQRVVSASLVAPDRSSMDRASMHVGYAGDLVTGLAEYGAVRADLVDVGALGVGLVLVVVFLFFMRLRALLAMGLTMAAGLAWTFGATALAIGHLNVATGFLVSIVAGNGINFGIIFMARYFEERHAGAPPADALATAHEQTWPSTLTAAVAAAGAYGSLGITNFRAFKHFGFIGGFGMLACWVATYTILPALLLVADRIRPFDRHRSLFGHVGGLRYDAIFTALVLRAPRTIAIVGTALAVLGAVLTVQYVRSDPMEYDMRRLQNDFGQSAEMYRVAHLASDVLGEEVEGAMVVALDRADQVRPFIDTLNARKAAASGDDKPFEAIHSLLDFVPTDQSAKVPVLLALRDRLVRAHDRGSITEADWREIAPKLPPAELSPYSINDLPDDLARPFTERSGERGRLVLIEPTAGRSDADLHYLLRWADSFRETRLPSGEVVRGSGRAVIFADMLQAVVGDIPRSIALSLGMTILAVLVTFRRGPNVFAVLAALGVGIGWVVLGMSLTHTKIHFFNFIALPITFGIGVDYAVNFAQRYEAEGQRGIVRVLRNTGGAVILCSMTTTLGYLALLTSINQAIRGLGMLAVMGEIGCLLAAVLVLPAGLLWQERARLAPSQPPTEIALPSPSEPHLRSR